MTAGVEACAGTSPRNFLDALWFLPWESGSVGPGWAPGMGTVEPPPGGGGESR